MEYDVNNAYIVIDMQNINIDRIALISAIPHVAMGAGLVLTSFTADYIRNNNIWSLTKVYSFFLEIIKAKITTK